MTDDNDTKFNITNFLFGNINVNGDLEEDIFDDATKHCMSTLKYFGIFNNLENNIQQEEINSGSVSEEVSVTNECVTSYDYSNISDLSSDENEEIIPPEHHGTVDIDLEDIKMPLKAQLAPLIPKELANMDVRQIFPDFQYNEILRFNRLFGLGKPSSLPKIWRYFGKRGKRLIQTYDEYLENTKKEMYKGSGASAKTESDELQIGLDDEIEFMKAEFEGSSSRAYNAESEATAPTLSNQEAHDTYNPTDEKDKLHHLGSTTDLFEAEKRENCLRYNMVTQLDWENDIIWDGGAILAGIPPNKENTSLQYIKNKLNITREREKFVGWLPTATIRNFQAALVNQQSEDNQNFTYTQAKMPIKSSSDNKLFGHNSSGVEQPSEMLMMPLLSEHNPHLIHYQWENDIIWDGELIKDQVDVSKWNETYLSNKPSSVIPPKTVQIYDLAEFDKMELSLNISNDQYYLNSKVNGGSIDSAILLSQVGTLQHSTPASELWPPFFPTHLGPLRLRTYHRPLLKKYSHGPIAHQGWHPLYAIENEIDKIAQVREKERLASGGGDMFFMHKPQDLSANDGDLILAEYSEEYPPLVMNVGMATHIKNYHKRRPGKETNTQEFEHGTTAYTHTSPFLGSLAPGQRIQALENNMFRAPIYLHKFPSTNFLVIRTRHHYNIRRLKDIFTVGQECPLMEVPCPNSKKTNIFLRDFLQVYLFRLFRASTDKPPKVYMEDVKRAFPNIAESSLRKKLKTFADFEKKFIPTDHGYDDKDGGPYNDMSSNKAEGGSHNPKEGKVSKRHVSNPSATHNINGGSNKRFQKRFRVWTLKPDFRLPSEEEIRDMVWPEHCCAWYSSLAAEHRLTEAGYALSLLGEGNAASATTSSNNAPSGSASNPNGAADVLDDDEVKAAPWNTTRAFLSAVRGKCLLDLNGTADPTGCGEGFSYIKMSNKPQQFKDDISGIPNSVLSKKSVTGTDADLRKLSLKNAKQLLRNFDVPEEELRKLSRWEIIDVVRTLSTQQALLGDDTVTKYARGNKFSATEHQEKFKEECQRIFDLQNRVLASGEILSTDEDSSGEDSDFEEMGKNIENMLANHKSKKGFESKSVSNGQRTSTKEHNKKDPKHQKISDRKLKITRTFRNHEGKEFVRIETVRNPGVVEAYLRIRESQDPELLAYFSRPDESRKQEMLKEKRRLVDQLKRLRAKEEKQRTLTSSSSHLPASTSNPGINYELNSSSRKTYNTKRKDGRNARTDNLTGPERVLLEESEVDTFQEGSSDKLFNSEKVRGLDDNVNMDIDDNSSKEAIFNPKVKCGACGEVGHMKTNRLCPLYEKSGRAPITVAMTQEEEEIAEQDSFDNNIQDLVNVEGTKIILSKTIIDHYDKIRKKSLILKFPKTSSISEVASTSTENQQHKKLKTSKACTSVLKKKIGPPSSSTGGKTSSKSSQFKSSTSTKKPYYASLKVHNSIKAKMMHHQKGKKNYKLVGTAGTYNAKYSRSTSASGAMGSNNRRRSSHGVSNWKRALAESGNQLDYLKKPHQSNKRRTIDPIVTLSSLLENILNDMRDLPDTQPFMVPVNIKNVPDYYQVILKPMDLQTMRENLHQRKYHTREDFLADATQIVENSRVYNGANSYLTSVAESMLELCVNKLGEKDERFMKLEKSINPLLDEDDHVALSFIFVNIIDQKLLIIPDSWPFHNPVNHRVLKDYYTKITQPMDLSTITKKAKEHKYRSQDDFLEDVKLLMDNSVTYNGPESTYTKIAQTIYETCVTELKASEVQINELQLGMEYARERASYNSMVDESSKLSYGERDDEGVTTEPYSNVELEVFDTNEKSLTDQETFYYGELENDLEITPDNSSNSGDSDTFVKDTSDVE